jgi:hypothetical protein
MGMGNYYELGFSWKRCVTVVSGASAFTDGCYSINDFMGGIFTAYYLTLKSTSSPLLIYTYLYAPGERKNVSLLQLEAIISTLSQSK